MKSRRILSIIGLTLAAVLLLGIGFAIGRNDEKKTVLVAPTESTAPRLIISAVHADSEYTSEKIQQTNDGTSDLDFCCIGLTDVTIDLGGNVMDLGNALREGKTSLSEISFLAQSDSQSGFCTEGWKSKNGLAEFRYSYPDFDLWIVDDIYETPDGLQHLIRGITLCQPGSDVAFLHNELDQEDWGIEFFRSGSFPNGNHPELYPVRRPGSRSAHDLRLCYQQAEPYGRHRTAGQCAAPGAKTDFHERPRHSLPGYRNLLWRAPCRAVRHVPVFAGCLQRRRRTAFNPKLSRRSMLLD